MSRNYSCCQCTEVEYTTHTNDERGKLDGGHLRSKDEALRKNGWMHCEQAETKLQNRVGLWPQSGNDLSNDSIMPIVHGEVVSRVKGFSLRRFPTGP